MKLSPSVDLTSYVPERNKAGCDDLVKGKNMVAKIWLQVVKKC